VMNTLRSNNRLLNNDLTIRVIDLHDQGFTNDFLPTENKHFLCLQDSVDFSIDDIVIKVIDEGYDQLTNSYKYIHTIETVNGSKGLLVADRICTGSSLVN
jgi:hypothetical protein